MNEIRNCEFKFKCPKEWELLIPTIHKDQRFCGECDRTVYLCKTGTELMTAIREDRCVAVKINDGIVVGMAGSPYGFDRNGE